MKNIINIAVVGLGQVGIYLLNELNTKKKDIEIKTVSNVDSVLRYALTKELKPVEWIEVENIPKSKNNEKPIAGSTH